MTVPALTTDNIGAFAWWRQDSCYSVELSDVLDYVVYYEQQPEYVDTILFQGTSGGPIDVRIRSDGYILAWQSKELSTGIHTINSVTPGFDTLITPTSLDIEYYYGSNAVESDNELIGAVIEMLSGAHSGKQYMISDSTSTTITVRTVTGTSTYDTLSNGDTFRIYSTRSNLVYNSTGTTLAYTIKLIWDQLRTNQIGGSGDALTDYTEVNNYDYEYTNATSLHIFGRDVAEGTGATYCYMTQPSGNTIYAIYTKGVTTNNSAHPYINLNGTRILNFQGNYYPNMKEIDITLLRSIQVRNEFYCVKSHYRTYFYFLVLTND